jgi:hypothetical protein
VVKDFEVFDRWGNMVSLRRIYSKSCGGWDGSFDGKPMNPGVYICKMTALMVNGILSEFCLGRNSRTLKNLINPLTYFCRHVEESPGYFFPGNVIWIVGANQQPL